MGVAVGVERVGGTLAVAVAEPVQLGVGEVKSIHGYMRNPLRTLGRRDPRQQEFDKRGLPRPRITRNPENRTTVS